MRKIRELRLECEPIGLVTHQLMHRSVTFVIHTVIMWVNQVALNVIEGFHFNAAHLLFCAGAHRWIILPVNKLTDSKDGNDAQVLYEH